MSNIKNGGFEMSNTNTPWTTKAARGMGPYYHHLQGLSRKEILIECTYAEAQLISAAPDLLEALAKLVEFSGMLAESPEGSKAVESARTAIAKATQSQ